MVSAAKGASQAQPAFIELHWDVNKREFPEWLKGAKLDHQFEWKTGETLESALTRAGVKNIGKAIEQGLQIFVDGGNVLAGAGQAIVGGALGVLTSLDDVAFATLAAAANGPEWILKHDDDFKAHSEAYKLRSQQIKDNLSRIKNDQDWDVFVDGLKRIRNGAGFGLADAAGMTVDALQATLQLSGGIALGAGKPLAAAILEVLSWPFKALEGVAWAVKEASGYIGDKLHAGAKHTWESSELAKI